MQKQKSSQNHIKEVLKQTHPATELRRIEEIMHQPVTVEALTVA